MIKKFLILTILILTTSCGGILLAAISTLAGDKRVPMDKDYISLNLLTKLVGSKGDLMRLGIVGNNNPYRTSLEDSGQRCAKQSDFAFTYSVNIKAPSVRIQGAHPEFEFVKNGVTKGRFKINKSDIYLLHQNQKFYPTIYWREYEYDTIESASVSYLNYKRYGTLYAKFDLPCTKLLDPDTKLVISKIYKDDKVIESNIEFGFVKSGDNQGYSIWLE